MMGDRFDVIRFMKEFEALKRQLKVSLAQRTGDWDFAAINLTTTGTGTFGFVNTTDETKGYQIDSVSLITRNITTNVEIGESICGGNFDFGQHNVLMGYEVGFNNKHTVALEGEQNVYIGYKTGYGGTAGVDNTGYQNVAMGMQALYFNTEGYGNIALGLYALVYNTTGYYNNAIGTYALFTNTEGFHNIAIGGSTLYTNVSGTHNAAIGSWALYKNTHSYNTGIGSWALYNNTSGTYNTGIGIRTLHENSTGNYNIAIGPDAGYKLTGSSNVFIGYKSGYWQTASSALLIIDNQDRGNAANELAKCLIYGVFDSDPANQTLGLNANVGIGTTTPDTKLQVVGDCKFGDDNTNYAQFATDGELSLVGTAKVKRHIRVAAPSWKGGATAPEEKRVGIVPVLGFDKSSDDSVHYSLIIPWRMESGTNMDCYVDWCYTGTQDNGSVCWGLEYINIGSNIAVSGTSITTADCSTGTHTTGNLVRTHIGSITGLNNHDVLGLRIYRDASEDNLNTDAELIQTHFGFTQDKLGEAI